jgi:hypothetical protein
MTARTSRTIAVGLAATRGARPRGRRASSDACFRCMSDRCLLARRDCMVIIADGAPCACQRMLQPRITIPSGRPGLPARGPIRLFALLAVRDEAHYLPGFLANVERQVDAIVALDDGSTDGSAELLESSPTVLEVLRVGPDRPFWDEVGNYRRLVQAALAYEPDWLVSLDADDRLEHRFRERAERVIRRGALFGLSGYAVRYRELWDSPEQYRVDGIWGRKAAVRLFRSRPDHEFDTRPLHAFKAPLQARRPAGTFPIADLEIYHLRMINREDRLARRARYERADPFARWQPGIGYGYLTDEAGIRLRNVPRRRGFYPAADR